MTYVIVLHESGDFLRDAQTRRPRMFSSVWAAQQYVKRIDRVLTVNRGTRNSAHVETYTTLGVSRERWSH